MFGCHGKYHFPENDFRLTNIFTFDPEIIFSPHFHFKSLPEREREREKREPRLSAHRSRRSFDDRTAPTSSAVHDRERRSSGAIDNRDRRSRSSLVNRRARLSENCIARRSTSSTIVRRARSSDECARRSTNGAIAIVDYAAHRTSVLPDLMHFLVKCLNEPNTKINFP